jgi:hypothetical protein
VTAATAGALKWEPMPDEAEVVSSTGWKDGSLVLWRSDKESEGERGGGGSTTTSTAKPWMRKTGAATSSDASVEVKVGARKEMGIKFK